MIQAIHKRSYSTSRLELAKVKETIWTSYFLTGRDRIYDLVTFESHVLALRSVFTIREWLLYVIFKAILGKPRVRTVETDQVRLRIVFT